MEYGINKENITKYPHFCVRKEVIMEESDSTYFYKKHLGKRVKAKYQDNGVTCAVIGVLEHVDEEILVINGNIVNHHNSSFVRMELWR